jgi:spoIIIJ-associated protein
MNQEKIKEIVEDFLKAYRQDAQVSVSLQEDKVWVSLKSKDSGRLIGRHGEALAAMQFILSLIIQKQFPSVKVIVDINDYKIKQEEILRSLALKAAQEAKFSRKEVHLRPMTGYERLIIHTALNNFADIETYSLGEGAERHIVVRSKLKSA